MIKKTAILLFIITVALILFAETPWIKNRAAHFAKSMIEQATGLKVEMKSLEYSFPLSFTAEQVAFSKQGMPRIQIDNLSFRASAKALFRSELILSHIRLSHVQINDENPIQPSKAKEATIHSIEPRIPLYCRIDQFEIQDIQINSTPPLHSIKGSIEADPEKGVSLQADSQSLSLKLLLHLKDSLDGSNFKISLHDLSALERWTNLKAKGEFSIEGTLNGSLQQPRLFVKGTSRQLYLLGHVWENFTASLNSSYANDKFQGDASFKSFGDAYQLKGFTAYAWKPLETLELSNFKIEGPLTSIEGSLNAHLSRQEIHASFLGHTHDLSLLEEAFDEEVTGKLQFQAELYPDSQEGQMLSLKVESPLLNFGEIALHQARIQTTVKGLLDQPQAAIHAHAEKTESKFGEISQLAFETQIDSIFDSWPFAFTCKGNSGKLEDLNTHGIWGYTRDSAMLQLAYLEATAFGFPVRLEKPLKVVLQPGIIKTSPFSIQIGGGQLKGILDLNQESVKSDLSLIDFPLPMMNRLSNLFPMMEGKLQAQIALEGTPENPKGKWRTSLTEVLLKDQAFSNFPILESSLEMETIGNRLALLGEIKGLENQPVTLKGSIPIIFRFNPFSFELGNNEPLDLALHAKGELVPLLKLIYLDALQLSGKTNIALTVGGTLKEPVIKGTLEIADGTYESYYNGTLYRNLHASLEGEGKELLIKTFSASDPAGGRIQGKGMIQLDREKGFPFLLEAFADKARLLNQDFATAQFTGSISLEGNREGGQIKGEIASDNLNVYIPDQMKQSQDTLEVTFINENLDQMGTYRFEKKPYWPIALDINLKITAPASLKGSNLSSLWRGSASLKGTSDSPQLFGEFKSVQGTYMFRGKEFVIKQGSIAFNGDLKKTTLYVIAAKDLDKIIAEIIVRGPVKNPTISFRSNPPLSQREIVSWLLFGKGVSNITTTEGAELNQSIKNLNTSGPPDVLSKIQSTLKIDKIDINRSGDENANEVSVQVGKYISKGVMVSVSKNVTTDCNQVSLEAKLTKELKVQAEVGDDNEGQLMLKWKRDY